MIRGRKKRKDEVLIDEVTGAQVNSSVFRRLLPYLRPHVGLGLISLTMIFFTVGATLYLPRLLGRVVDEALKPGDRSALLMLAGIYFALEIGRLFAKLLQSYFLQRIGQSIMHTIRQELFSRLLRMPVPFYDRNPTGRLVTRLTNDTVNLADLFGPGFVMLISDCLIVIGVLIAMVLLNWQLGLIALTVVPFMYFVVNYFSRRLRKAYRGARRSQSAMNAFFAERMSGMITSQLMGMEDYERSRFDKLSTKYFNRQSDTVLTYALFQPSITILSATATALVLYFGGNLVAAEAIPIGIFVAFLSYVNELFQPIRGLTEKYNIYQNSMSSAERLFAILEAKEEPGLRDETGTELVRLQGKIDFQNVWFSYHPEGNAPQWALKDANFSIEPGKSVAIVGHTGAGKSTLISLLFRFYDPQRGAILIDDKPIQSYSKRGLRSRLGFVQQDIFVFAGSIRDNLLLLNHHASEKELHRAIEKTGLNKLLSRLPKGLDTELEERGSNLSQGERQLLAITRVLLQQPDILILDEATSHVDTDSERLIQSAIQEIVQNRTSILIAHRLSTIKDADRIMVFNHGQIVEAGTHNDLAAMEDGHYRHFLQLQT